MNKKMGFGLFGILIVIAIIALLVGGKLYKNSLQQKQSSIEFGQDAIKRAEDLKKLIEQRNIKEVRYH